MSRILISEYVHQSRPRNNHGRCSAVWRDLYRIILHLEQHLVCDWAIVVTEIEKHYPVGSLVVDISLMAYVFNYHLTASFNNM